MSRTQGFLELVFCSLSSLRSIANLPKVCRFRPWFPGRKIAVLEFLEVNPNGPLGLCIAPLPRRVPASVLARPL